jgi:hypothetical protein
LGNPEPVCVCVGEYEADCEGDCDTLGVEDVDGDFVKGLPLCELVAAWLGLPDRDTVSEGVVEAVVVCELVPVDDTLRDGTWLVDCERLCDCVDVSVTVWLLEEVPDGDSDGDCVCDGVDERERDGVDVWLVLCDADSVTLGDCDEVIESDCVWEGDCEADRVWLDVVDGEGDRDRVGVADCVGLRLCEGLVVRLVDCDWLELRDCVGLDVSDRVWVGLRLCERLEVCEDVACCDGEDVGVGVADCGQLSLRALISTP